MKAKSIRTLALSLALLAGTAPVQAAVINYGLGAVTGSNPATFVFTFTTATPTITGMADYSFTGSISLTDAGTDGVTAALGTLPEFWALGASGSGPVTTIADVGGTAALVGSGPFTFSASGSFDCSALAGGCSAMNLSFSFLLSGGQDAIASTGTFELVARESVPAPGTVALLGTGLIGLAAARRRASR